LRAFINSKRLNVIAEAQKKHRSNPRLQRLAKAIKNVKSKRCYSNLPEAQKLP
jgi:hypothetical protein